MKKVFISKKSTMVLKSLKNIDINHELYSSYYEAEVDNDFHVHVYGNAVVSGTAIVFGTARVFGTAIVYGNARVYGSAVVHENARVSENAAVFGHSGVLGNARVYGKARVSGTARVSENAEVYGSAAVSGTTRVFENAEVYGNAIVHGNAEVSGTAKSTGEVINLVGLPYNVTITDNHIQIGCKQFDFKTARKLAERNISIDDEEYKAMIKHKDILLLLIKTKELEHE